MSRSKPQPALRATFIAALFLATVFPSPTAAQAPEPPRRTVFEEDWENLPELNGWTLTTNPLTVRDNQNVKDGVWSLKLDPQIKGSLSKAERELNETFVPAPYEFRFFFRQEWPAWTDAWVTLQLDSGEAVKLDLSYGVPNNRTALQTSLGTTPVFFQFLRQTWYKATVTIDPLNHTAQAQIRDLNDNVKGNSPYLAFSPSATKFTHVSFASMFNGTGGISGEQPFPFNFDSIILRTAREPLAPTLSAHAGPGAGQITLTWQPGDDGGSPIQRYRIYAGNASNNLQPLAETSNNTTTTYVHAELAEGATRYYKVRAVNLIGEGDFSAEASATTYRRPSEPRNFTAWNGPGKFEAQLNFSLPLDEGGANVTGYAIYRGTSADALARVAQTPRVPTWRDFALLGNSTFYYSVRAVNVVGEGPATSILNITTPARPNWDECDLFRYVLDQPNLTLLHDNATVCTVTEQEVLAAPVPYIDANGSFNQTKLDLFLGRVQEFADLQGLPEPNVTVLNDLIAPRPLGQADPLGGIQRHLCLMCPASDPPEEEEPDGCGSSCSSIPPEYQEDAINDYFDSDPWEVVRGQSPYHENPNETVNRIKQTVSGLLDQARSTETILRQVPDLGSVLAMGPDVVSALAKCTDRTLGGVEGIAENATAGVVNVTPVEDATTCVSEIVRPLLWDLLNRVRATADAVQAIAQPATSLVQPVVDEALGLLPPTVRGWTKSLLDDPIDFLLNATVILDELDLAQIVSETVSNTEARAQVTVAGLVPASSRHPQLVYDLAHLQNLLGTLQALTGQQQRDIGDYNWEASQATGEKVNPIAVVDSFVFNLYTKRGGTERITPVVFGNLTGLNLTSFDSAVNRFSSETCIQLDTSILTRDVNGCDLYATFNMSAQPATGDLLAQGKIVSFTVKLRKAIPFAAIPLEALGYVQVFNEPYVMVLGYNMTDALGAPQEWEGTLTGYDTRADTGNRSISFVTSYTDPRPDLPIQVTAGAFRVNVSQPGKPVYAGNETSVFVQSPKMIPRVGVTQTKTTVPAADAEPTVAVRTTVDVPLVATLFLNMTDKVLGHEATTHFGAAALPAGRSQATYTRTGAADRQNLTWAAPPLSEASSYLNVTYTEGPVGAPARAFQAVGRSVPASLWAEGDFAQNDYRYSATGKPSELALILAERAHACPAKTTSVATSLIASKLNGRACLAARADGLDALGASTIASAPGELAHVWGRGNARSDGLTATVDNGGFQLHATASATPASWDARLVRSSSGERTLRWEASAQVAYANVSVAAPQPGGGIERGNLSAETVPPTLTASVDPALQVARVDGASAYGSAKGWLSNTGSAPTVEPAQGGYYLRAKRPVGSERVESAFRVGLSDSIRAEVVNGGEFHLAGALSSAKPLSAFYQNEDQSYTVKVDIQNANGTIDQRLAPSRALGTLTYRHAAGEATPQLVVKADTTQGKLDLTGTNVPPRLHIEASWLQGAPQSIRAWTDGSGTAGALDARFGADGQVLDRARPNSTLVYDRGANAPQGFTANLASFTDVQATRTGTQIRLARAGSGPLAGFFEALGDAYDSQATPATDVTTSLNGGTFTYTAGAAQSSADSVTFRARLATGQLFEASATGLARSLSATWPLARASNFQLDVTHDKEPTLGSLAIEARDPGATPSGWSLTGAALPRSLHVEMDAATGHVLAQPKNAAGQPATVGDVDIAFVNRGPNLRASTHLGDYVRLYEGDDEGSGQSATSGAIRMRDASNLAADLLPSAFGTPPGAAIVRVDRAVARSVHFEATSVPKDASVRFDTENANGTIDTRFSVDAPTGVFDTTTTITKPGESHEWSGHSQDRKFQVNASGPAPVSFRSLWTTGGAFNVTASNATTASAWTWNTPERLEKAGEDYFAARLTEDGVDAGMTLSKVHTIDFQRDAGLFRLRAQGADRPFRFNVQHPQGTVGMSATKANGSIDANWTLTALTRGVHVQPGAALPDFVLDARSTNQGRVRLESPLLPATGVDYNEDRLNGVFGFQAGQAVGTVNISTDDGADAPIPVLLAPGLEVARSASGQSIRLKGNDLTRLDYPADASKDAYGAVRLVATRGAPAAAGTFSVAIDDMGRIATARLDALGAGETVLAWGESNETENLRLHAHGAAGSALRMGYQTPSGDRGAAALTGAPGSWTARFEPSTTGQTQLVYAGSGSATSVRGNGTWRGGAFNLNAETIPPSFTASVPTNMLSGTITTTPGQSVGKLDLGLAPQSGGQVPITNPATLGLPGGSSLLMIDSAETAGTMSLNLTSLKSLTWSIPSATGSGNLVVDLQRAAATTLPGLVEVGHPQHQTRIRLPSGLATTTYLSVLPDASGWTSLLKTPSKDATVEYLDAAHKGFNLTAKNPPTGFQAKVSPGCGVNPVRVNSTGNLQELSFQTTWGNGAARGTIQNLPDWAVLESQLSCPSMTGYVLSNKSVGRVDLMIVPNASNTVNHVEYSAGDYLAVEAGGKAPYAALSARNLLKWNWTLPGVGAAPNVDATLARSANTTYTTRVDLASLAGDDYSALLQNAGREVWMRAEGATPSEAPNAQPARMVFGSKIGTTTRATTSYVTGPTRQGTTANWTTIANGATSSVRASGLGNVSLSNQGGLPKTVDLWTVDRGNVIKLNVTDPSALVEADMQSGACTAPGRPFLHVNTSGATTGRFLLQYGSSLPTASEASHVLVNCDPFGVNIEIPNLNTTTAQILPCGFEGDAPGVRGLGVPVKYATPQAWVNATFDPEDLAGRLHLVIKCEDVTGGKKKAQIAYSTNGVNGTNPATHRVRGIVVDYTSTNLTNTNGTLPTDCMQVEGRCVETINIMGESLPPAASLNATAGPGTLDIQIAGQKGKTLEVRMKLAHAAKDPEGDLVAKISAKMPLDKVIFLKTDVEQPATGGPTRNRIIRDDAPDRTTLYIETYNLVNATFELRKQVEPEDIRAVLDYNGHDAGAFELFMIDRDCARTAVQIFDMPPALNLTYQKNSLIPEIDVSKQTAGINRLEAAVRFGNACGNGSPEGDPNEGWELAVELKDVPGPWGFSSQYGAQGFIHEGATVPGQFIGEVEVSWRSVADHDRYVGLHLEQVHSKVSWNIDAQAGDPFFYCDTDGGWTGGKLRARWDYIGVGLVLPDAGLECERFMLRGKITWMSALQSIFAWTGVVSPPEVQRYGCLRFEAELPNIEIFLVTDWWGIDFPQMRLGDC